MILIDVVLVENSHRLGVLLPDNLTLMTLLTDLDDFLSISVLLFWLLGRRSLTRSLHTLDDVVIYLLDLCMHVNFLMILIMHWTLILPLLSESRFLLSHILCRMIRLVLVLEAIAYKMAILY